MKKTLAIAAILTILALLSPTRAAAADKLDLKLQFEKAQQLTLTTTVEQNTTRTWNDQERESKGTTSTTMGLNVLSVADGGTATIKVTIKSIVLKREGGRRSFEYDSDNPPDEVPRRAAPYAALVGKTFTMKLTPTGQVTDLEGVEAMLKAAEDAVPEGGRGRQWLIGEVKRRFGEDGLKQTMEGAFGFLPTKPVAVGDSWKRTIATDNGVPVIAEQTYTLAKRGEGTATIELKATLKPHKDGAATRRGRGTVKYEVSGTQKGTLTVDEATGCLFKVTIAQKLEGKMLMSGFRGDDTERSMPIKSEATVTVETKRQKPDKADRIELKFRFEEGKSYKLQVTMEMEIVQWIEGEEQETTQTIGIGETLHVKEVDADGTATIELTFGPMSIKMKGPMGTIEYNSEDPPDEVALPAKAFAAMLGQGFTLKMTPTGRVTDIQGVDKMFEAIFEAIDIPEGPMMDSVVEGLKQQFGDEALKEMMEKMTAVFPDKPVAIGDSWSLKATLATGFPVIMENTWTLTDRKDGVATINVESTFKPNPEGEPMKIGPMTMRFRLKGSQKGTFKLDEATGWFIEGELTQKMAGEVTMKGIPGQTEEMSVPMTIETVMKFESK